MSDLNLIKIEEADKVEIIPASKDLLEKPVLPSDLKAVFLGGIFTMMLLTVLRIASAIVIPIVLAFVLKLVLQPIFRWFIKQHIPRPLAAGVIIITMVCSVAALGTVISAPAVTWAEKLPESYPQLRERLTVLSKPMEKTQKIIVQAEDFAKTNTKVVPVSVAGTTFSDRVLTDTQVIVSEMFTTLLVLFFLLAADDTFLRKLVEVLPNFKDKRQAVDISQHVESDIARYLLTITVINACVGILAGSSMALFGVENALLWGTLAFLLNYIPIVGALIGVGIYLLVGVLVIPDSGIAFMPAATYMIIHIIEGSAVTPLLVARRFMLNPVIIIISLVFWYWMWGIPGAILAMPMLAIVKIICDRIQRLAAFGHFLGV